jgi:hypothetical protein
MMGWAVLFWSQKRENLYAVWKDFTGKEYTTALPAETEGVILSVTEVEGRKIIIVKRSRMLLMSINLYE